MHKVFVRHWRYDDGWHDLPEALIDRQSVITSTKFYNKEVVGWHCWAYPSDNDYFEEWMERSMAGKYDIALRFNSGDPMFTVHIVDPADATLFKLTWI
jgi:hypothetical protein